MAIEFDHVSNLINITSPQDTLTCQELINAIRDEESSATGIWYPQIAGASGKESLGAGVEVGMTVELVAPWQVKFWAGDYIAKITGGNLVGGPAGDPIAYSAGVQVLLVQSAASTIVTTGGSALTTEEHNQLMSRPGLVEISESVWQELLDAGFSSGDIMRLLAAANAGKLSGADTGNIIIRDLADSKDRITATTDVNGNRTLVNYNVSE